MVEMPGIKEPERVRKLLQGSANLEFWETYNSQEIYPLLAQLNQKYAITGGDAEEAVADTTATEATADTTAVAAATNDLAAKLAANKKDAKAADAKAKAEALKQNPLFAVFQPVPQGLAIVGYANARDTADVNKVIYSDIARQVLPAECKLRWGAKAEDFGGENTKGDIFALYALKVTEPSGRAPLEGDVITSSKDDFDQMGHPSVSMQMNSDGARRWSQITKQNIGRGVAIVLDDAVYSYYQQKAHIESRAYPYTWIKSYAYPERQVIYNYDYPFSPTGIFGSAKERYQCSNGMIFASDEWVFDPTLTYNTYRYVEGEAESSVISYTDCTMTKIDALGDSISARAFTHIKPSGGNSNWNVTYKLTNALSTTYDVYVRVLPKSVTGGENKRPCRFTATINYYDEEGKEQHYTFNNGTPINTNPNIVDVVKVGTFKIPTCNYGQGDGGQPSITLTCSIRANENAKYDRNFYLDDIILYPVVKE